MIDILEVVEPSPEQMLFVIRGMRNPLNSWIKSDSRRETFPIDGELDLPYYEKIQFLNLGDKDAELMTKLALSGPEHRKYMRMMWVGMTIQAPLYWWKEFDTYKIGTVSNSCSTMHKIAEKTFYTYHFSTEHLTEESKECLQNTVDWLNFYRTRYLTSKDKEDWWQMIQLLPSSYNQMRNVTMNYEVLADIYYQRKDHKLDEWRKFCEQIEKLEYFKPTIASVQNAE